MKYYECSRFGYGNYALRVVWHVGYFSLFRFTLRPMHAWRRMILRLFGAKIGKGVNVYPGAKIWAPWNLELKDYVGVADGVYLYNQAKIVIGDRSIVSEEAFICTGTHDYTKFNHPHEVKSIEIGSDVWLCARVFICPGVVIGDGCVIGACSLVDKNTVEWSVYAGQPAKFIKKRIMRTS